MEKNFVSIYIHIPFCVRKCNYCAFNSEIAGEDEKNSYVDALSREIKNFATGENVDTIYFGGGTPSTLTLTGLEKIFSTVQKNFRVASNLEITIEINPCTVDENFLRGLREIGFNRLSIGVQSFDDRLLKILGRIHDSRTAAKTIEDAKKFFDNVSADLIYSLPGEKLSDVAGDVERAKSFDVQHISIYELEIEPGTKFFQLDRKGKLNLPDADESEKMYNFITENLPAAGYRRYEISNFARSGFESRHNTGYWTDKKYFGFGAGAHGYDGNFRTANFRNVETYIKKIFSGETVREIQTPVTPQAAREEFCFLGLRLAEGIDIAKFEKKFGVKIFDVYGKIIEKNLQRGLLKNSGDKIFLTERGMKFGNIVFADFLED